MKHTIVLSFFVFAFVGFFTPLAEAQPLRIKLSRRQRLHRRWSNSVSTGYLTTAHYNSCWSQSQNAVAPTSAMVNLRYQSCLRRRKFRLRRGRHQIRIRKRCRRIANAPVVPTELQQRDAYIGCLRRTRYNLIKNYLFTVSCDHLRGVPRRRCKKRLYREIANYGYNNPAHLNYLDNLYRTRYRSFRTRYPRHSFVRKYHKRHHLARRRKAVKHRRAAKHHRANRRREADKRRKANRRREADKGRKANRRREADKGRKANRRREADKGRKANRRREADKGRKANRRREADKGRKANRRREADKRRKANKRRSRKH